MFGYYVQDPERFGIVEFDKDGKVLSVEEKPQHPKSNYAITVTFAEDADKDGTPDKYDRTLTYDANGGRIAGETTFVVPDLAQQTGYELGEEDDYTAPTHTDTEGTAVLFLGWTTTDNHEKIYDAGEQLPTLVSEVNIPAVATVYAVWAYDRNGDGTPDARQIMI